jgi:hypothetical protein
MVEWEVVQSKFQ